MSNVPEELKFRMEECVALTEGQGEWAFSQSVGGGFVRGREDEGWLDNVDGCSSCYYVYL